MSSSGRGMVNIQPLDLHFGGHRRRVGHLRYYSRLAKVRQIGWRCRRVWTLEKRRRGDSKGGQKLGFFFCGPTDGGPTPRSHSGVTIDLLSNQRTIIVRYRQDIGTSKKPLSHWMAMAMNDAASVMDRSFCICSSLPVVSLRGSNDNPNRFPRQILRS